MKKVVNGICLSLWGLLETLGRILSHVYYEDCFEQVNYYFKWSLLATAIACAGYAYNNKGEKLYIIATLMMALNLGKWLDLFIGDAYSYNIGETCFACYGVLWAAVTWVTFDHYHKRFIQIVFHTVALATLSIVLYCLK